LTEHFRILHVLRAPVGGLFRHVLDLSAAQAERGHDVGLVFDSTNTDPLSEARLAKVAGALSLGVTRMPMGRWPGLADASASRAVAALASAKGADVLHGHGAKGGAYARLAAKLVRFQGQSVAAFYTPHGGSLHFPPGSPAALAFIGMEKVLARFTDGLIFESDYIRREYERRVGAGLAPTAVITNGLQPSDFGTHEPRADAADFLFVGELRQLKGVDVLLRALAELKRTQPVSAVIVGAGPDREAFERLAEELQLTGAVTFPGPLPAAQAFPRGRATVVPSRAESLPFIVMEAAAAQVPLIATDVGGILEIVAGSDTPLLPAGDVQALARALQAFLDDPGTAKARALRLQQTVQKRFAIGATTAAVLDFYAAHGHAADWAR
jgi:glycosyltransferase involved in cell wall biosynthesis